MGESKCQIRCDLPVMLDATIEFIAKKKRISKSKVIKAIVIDYLAKLTNEGEVLLEEVIDEIKIDYERKED